MSVAALRPRPLPGHSLLVEHWLVLGFTCSRPPARARLDEAIGHELARRLVFALTRAGRDDG
jgi:hypothetical protein